MKATSRRDKKVVSVIATQFQRDSNGSASAPPILIFPSGEKAAQTQVRRKEKAAQAKTLEKTANMPLFSEVVVFKKACGLMRLSTTMRMKTVSGIQNTMGRTLTALSAEEVKS